MIQVIRGERRATDSALGYDVWNFDYQIPLEFQERGKLDAPKDAFFFFLEVQGPSFKEKYPNLTVQEFIQRMVQQWEDLSHEEKQTFENLAKQDLKKTQQLLGIENESEFESYINSNHYPI